MLHPHPGKAAPRENGSGISITAETPNCWRWSDWRWQTHKSALCVRNRDRVWAVTVVSATQITATFTIAANAPLGGANVKVTTSTGTSAPAVFTVNAECNSVG